MPLLPSYSSLLSLHDALPICLGRFQDFVSDQTIENKILTEGDMLRAFRDGPAVRRGLEVPLRGGKALRGDRKSTRLNSSHQIISYAVFGLKEKQAQNTTTHSC